jgi:predicted nucleic acid-binding protein
MDIVVDTNILVRVLISPDGVVAKLFYPLKQYHNLYIAYTSIQEINKHKRRLLRFSELTAEDFDLMLLSILSNVSVVRLESIPDSVFIRSFLFISGLDNNDVPFVATSLFTRASLWTSDKDLYYGLRKKGFGDVLNNADIKKIIKGNS